MNFEDPHGVPSMFAELSVCHEQKPETRAVRNDLPYGLPQCSARSWHAWWESADTPRALLDMVLPFVHGVGFKNIGYTLGTSLPVSAPRTLSVSNFPTVWEEGKGRRGAIEGNPIVKRCLGSMRPLVWEGAQFEDAPPFQAALRHAGIRSGWAHHVRDSRGGWGVLTVCRDTEHPALGKLFDIEPSLVWLTQMFHYHLTRVCHSEHWGADEIHLTDVEKIILRWTVDGKTSGELAAILEVSARTINFHVQNILVKMNACNKAAAAAQAALLGLLY